jgi:hypothetical protein
VGSKILIYIHPSTFSNTYLIIVNDLFLIYWWKLFSIYLIRDASVSFFLFTLFFYVKKILKKTVCSKNLFSNNIFCVTLYNIFLPLILFNQFYMCLFFLTKSLNTIMLKIRVVRLNILIYIWLLIIFNFHLYLSLMSFYLFININSSHFILLDIYINFLISNFFIYKKTH